MPRGDRSTATREALLQSAARVFTRRGQYGATVREIAEDAGLTVPAIYYHFEGTDQLFRTLVQEGRARIRDLLTEALACPGDPVSRLHAIARVFVRFGQEDPTRLRLLCANLFGPHDGDGPDVEGAALNAWIRSAVGGVVGDLDAGGNGHGAASTRLLLALLNGLLVEQARTPDVPVLDDAVADEAVRLFLHGVGR